MNIIILGAAGFIGTNLFLELAKNIDNKITLVDINKDFFPKDLVDNCKNVCIKEAYFEMDMNLDEILLQQDVVYHLVSSSVPTTSNQQISQELSTNIVFTTNMLEACVRCGVKKVVFISSGGTVYGKEVNCPLKEDSATYPINAYGIQKITIEKLMYLYNYLYGLDYRVVRLANPYGPYQRPNGVLGAVTTFVYKALKNEEIVVYGDGTVVRDFIYINDAIRAIINIVEKNTKYKTFNLGCGYGTSIKQVLDTISEVLGVELNITYKPGRKVDVPVNYLDISRYEDCFGKLKPLSLTEGVKKTVEFMQEQYNI